jgi:hypothetical protein
MIEVEFSFTKLLLLLLFEMPVFNSGDSDGDREDAEFIDADELGDVETEFEDVAAGLAVFNSRFSLLLLLLLLILLAFKWKMFEFAADCIN